MGYFLPILHKVNAALIATCVLLPVRPLIHETRSEWCVLAVALIHFDAPIKSVSLLFTMSFFIFIFSIFLTALCLIDRFTGLAVALIHCSISFEQASELARRQARA